MECKYEEPIKPISIPKQLHLDRKPSLLLPFPAFRKINGEMSLDTLVQDAFCCYRTDNVKMVTRYPPNEETIKRLFERKLNRIKISEAKIYKIFEKIFEKHLLSSFNYVSLRMVSQNEYVNIVKVFDKFYVESAKHEGFDVKAVYKRIGLEIKEGFDYILLDLLQLNEVDEDYMRF